MQKAAEIGVDINSNTPGRVYGTTLSEKAFSHAADCYHQGIEDKVRFLIECGVYFPGESIYICHPEILKMVLIQNNFDVNAENEDGTLLYKAACCLLVWKESLAYDAVKLLLEAGADVNKKSNPEWETKGCTALMGAARKGFKSVVELLLQNGADVTIRDDAGKTALDYAETDEIKQLIREKELEALYDSQEKINEKDSNGFTPLINAVKDGDKFTVTWLLDHGADLDLKDNYGRTALIYAVVLREKEIETILLNKGANKYVCDDYGKNYLDYKKENGIGSNPTGRTYTTESSYSNEITDERTAYIFSFYDKTFDETQENDFGISFSILSSENPGIAGLSFDYLKNSENKALLVSLDFGVR